jgi:hypothetical protein
VRRFRVWGLARKQKKITKGLGYLVKEAKKKEGIKFGIF